MFNPENKTENTEATAKNIDTTPPALGNETQVVSESEKNALDDVLKAEKVEEKKAALRAKLYGVNPENAKKVDAKIDQMSPGQLSKVDKMADWARRHSWEGLENGECTSEPVTMNVSKSRFSYEDSGNGLQKMFIYKSESGKFFAGHTEDEARQQKFEMAELYGNDNKKHFVAVIKGGLGSLNQEGSQKKPNKGLLSRLLRR